MKFLPLVWRNLMRRKIRTFVTLLSILVAFVLFGAWLCTYRFMYYDVFVAAVGVVTLMADPRPFFRRAWWPFASWVAILVGMLLLIENVAGPLNVEITASVQGLKGTAEGATGKTAPTIYLASGDYYPWDTAAVFALWVWCAIRLMWSRGEPAAAGSG